MLFLLKTLTPTCAVVGRRARADNLGAFQALSSQRAVSRILEWDEDNLPILGVGGRKEPVEKSELEAWARGRAEARGRCLESGLGMCQAPMESE